MLHWSGTRCRMNRLALVRPSPVAHRSKMSRTGLSMQSNCVILGYHGTHTHTNKNITRQTLGFLPMKTAREKEPEALLTLIMSSAQSGGSQRRERKREERKRAEGR